MDTSDQKKHIVFVQCVESKKAVKGILQRIQGNGKGIHVSMAIHQNVLAVIVAGGPAFVIPNSKTQDNFIEKKRMIAEILENPMITKVRVAPRSHCIILDKHRGCALGNVGQ